MYQVVAVVDGEEVVFTGSCTAEGAQMAVEHLTQDYGFEPFIRYVEEAA